MQELENEKQNHIPETTTEGLVEDVILEKKDETFQATESLEENTASSSPFNLSQKEVKENLTALQKNIEAFGSKVGEGVREGLAKAEFTPEHLLNYIKTFFSFQTSQVLTLPRFDIVTLSLILLGQAVFLTSALYLVFSSVIRMLTFGFVTTIGFYYFVKLLGFVVLSGSLGYLSLIYVNRRLLGRVDFYACLDSLAKINLPLILSAVPATFLGFFSPSFALFLLSLGFLSTNILYVFEILSLTAQSKKTKDSFHVLYEIIFLLVLTHFIVFYLIVN